MRRNTVMAGVVFLALVLFSSHAFGIPIVDQTLDPAGYGFTSMYGFQNILEDFTLSTQTQLTGVSWYGLFSNGTAATNQSSANFDVLFFSNNDKLETTTSGGTLVSGLPNYQPFFETTLSGVKGAATAFSDSLHGGTIYKWDTDIPQVSLDAGKYWIVLRSSLTESSFFLWSHSANEDGYTVQGILPASFIPPYDPKIRFWTVSDEIYDEQAFTLYGTAGPSAMTVPEPTTVFLLSFGLFWLAVCAKKSFKEN